MISIKDIGKLSFILSIIFFFISARAIIGEAEFITSSAYFKWIIIFAQSVINAIMFLSISSKLSLHYAWPKILDNDKFEDSSLIISKVNGPQKLLIFFGFVINLTIFSFLVFEVLSCYKADINIFSMETRWIVSTASIITTSLFGILYSLTFLKRV